MEFNESEKQRILDEGMLTRSVIENEVAMKKCQLYSELASDPMVKAFFKDQAKQLEDSLAYIRGAAAELH